MSCFWAEVIERERDGTRKSLMRGFASEPDRRARVHTHRPNMMLPTCSEESLEVAIYLLCVFSILIALSFFSGVAWDDARNWSPFVQEPPCDLKHPRQIPRLPTEPHRMAQNRGGHSPAQQELNVPRRQGGQICYFSEHVNSTFILWPVSCRN